VLEHRTLWSSDILSDARFELSPEGRAFIERAGYRAPLAVPLHGSSGVIGAIMSARNTPGPYSPEQVRLLEALAAHAGIAIETARLFRAESARHEAMEALVAVDRELLGELDTTRLLSLIADSAARVCRAETVVHLVRDDGRLVARVFSSAATLPGRVTE